MRLLASALAVTALLIATTVVRAEEVFARNTDKQIKALVEKIGKDQQTFRRALANDFRKSVVRGPDGELKVEDFLKDFNTATKRIESRFTSKYSASTEVQQLLQLGTWMHAYVRANPAMKGANEWDPLANDLNALAGSYGAKFPPDTDAPIRRVGDAELTDALTALDKAVDGVASELKKAIKSTPALSATGPQTLRDLGALEKASSALESRISGGNPATAEARQVVTLGASISAALAGAPQTVAAAWTQVAAPLKKVAQAFGL